MINCKYCSQSCVKAGVRKTKRQTYRCKNCGKYQQHDYSNGAYHSSINKDIVSLLIEGVGIRSISRILSISMTTVINRIKRIAQSINKTYTYVKNGVYEIDELWTYIGKKDNETWIAYVIDRASKKVI